MLAENGLAKATHVVLRHQQQPAYAEAVRLGKQTVSCYWVLACVQQGQLVACTDVVRRSKRGCITASIKLSRYNNDMPSIATDTFVAATSATSSCQHCRHTRYRHNLADQDALYSCACACFHNVF